jgi:hypothetical protein
MLSCQSRDRDCHSQDEEPTVKKGFVLPVERGWRRDGGPCKKPRQRPRPVRDLSPAPAERPGTAADKLQQRKKKKVAFFFFYFPFGLSPVSFVSLVVSLFIYDVPCAAAFFLAPAGSTRPKKKTFRTAPLPRFNEGDYK